MEIAAALHRLFPSEWKIDGYSRLLVNADTLGDSPEDIMQSWNAGLQEFRHVRERVLIYK